MDTAPDWHFGQTMGTPQEAKTSKKPQKQQLIRKVNSNPAKHPPTRGSVRATDIPPLNFSKIQKSVLIALIVL
jgi:hypothetical protein